MSLCQTHHQARPGMHSHLRARFGFCNDHIWPLNAFKMFLMFQEVGLRAGSDTGYRASVNRPGRAKLESEIPNLHWNSQSQTISSYVHSYHFGISGRKLCLWVFCRGPSACTPPPFKARWQSWPGGCRAGLLSGTRGIRGPRANTQYTEYAIGVMSSVSRASPRGGWA